ncbi:MAG: tetratricopeptide repeat protein [Phycisphaeraceae bacterium]
MASRVNTKFVILLSAALVALVGCIGIFWFVFIHRDPEEMIQRGDQHMADGEYEEAIENYSRALGRRTNDPDLLNKYYDVLMIAPVDSDLIAQRHTGQLQESLRMISALRLDDQAALQRYYQLLWTLARDNLTSHARIHQVSDRRLQDDPNNVIARRYRGMAQTRRLSADQPRDEQLQAREDLLFALEHRPDDAELIHHLVRWNLFEADRLDRPGGDREQAAQLRSEARALSQQMFEAQPDDRHRQLMHIQLLMNPGIDAVDEARPLADALEATLLEDPQPRHIVLATVSLLPQLDRTVEEDESQTLPRGIRRALALLDAAVAAHPDEADYRLALGRYLAATGEHDDALEQFAQARQMAQEAPALDYLRWRQAGLEASVQQADLLVSRIPQAESSEERQALRQEVDAIVDQLTEHIPDASALRMLTGKLHLLDGELGQAAIAFDEVSLDTNRRNPDALRLAAHAHRRLGDWGAAADRLEALAAMQPGRLDTQVELADIYLSGGQVEQARQRLDMVLEQSPDHAGARQLQARLLARTGEVDQAIEAYQTLDNVQNAQMVAELVRLYAANEQVDEAIALLQRRLEQAPADLQAVQMLLALADEDESVDAQALLDQAEEAGANAQALNRLRRLQAGEEITLDEAIEEALAARENPVERALLRAEIARRQGDVDTFREALDEAEEHDRTHDRVIELQFDLALSDEDWSRAERYARLARDRNLDLANGDFYQGRLAAARGDLRESIGYFRRALTARPVYSDGHRFHGDALRLNRDYSEALEAYRQAVEQRPSNVQALRGLAAAHDALGERTPALSRLRQALQYSPRDESLLNQYLLYEQTHGDRDRAIAMRRQLAEAAPDRRGNRRNLAVLLAQSGEVEQAMTEVQALLADEGETRTNIALLAEVHRLAGEAEQGLAVIDQYIDDRGDERVAEDYLILARYKRSLNDGQGMRKAYEQAMSLDETPGREVTREFADLLFERGLFDEAAPLYERLHEQFADDAAVAMRLAEARIQMGEPEQAETILARLPESTERLALEAIVARLNGELAQARQAIDRAIARDNTNPLLYVERARIHLASPDQRNDAEADVNEALRLNPELAAARQMLVQLLIARGDTTNAKRELRTLLSYVPQHTQARLLLLELYLNDNETRPASNLLAEARGQAPDNPLWPRLQAQVAARNDDVEAAVEHWRHAVDLAATPANVIDAAAYLIEQERADAALELLGAHDELVARYAVAQAVRAQALALTGQEAEAVTAFGAALNAAANPAQLGVIGSHMVRVWGVSGAIDRIENVAGELPLIKRQLAAAHVEIGSSQHEQAVNRLQAILPEIEQTSTELRQFVNQMLATSLHESGAYDQARDAYRRMLEADPNNVTALNNLAYLLVSVYDDPEQAMPLAERAAELAPENASVLDTWGWTQYKMGLHGEAQLTLEQALAINPLAPTYLHLGTLYMEQDERERAQNLLAEAVKLAEQADDAATLDQAQRLLEQLQP